MPGIGIVDNVPVLPGGMGTHEINRYIIYFCNQSVLSSLRCQRLPCHFLVRVLVVSLGKGQDSLTWAIWEFAARKGTDMFRIEC